MFFNHLWVSAIFPGSRAIVNLLFFRQLLYIKQAMENVDIQASSATKSPLNTVEGAYREYSPKATIYMRKYLDLIWLRGIGSLKADVKQSFLGMLWWVLEPLLMVALFYLAFASGIRGSGHSGSNFIYFLLTGLFPFKWTASALATGANSLIGNKGILGQAYLPKWIFPSVANLTAFIRFSFIFPLMLLLVIMGGYEPSTNWPSIINIILCQILFNLGISFFLSALVPLIPDLTHLVPLIIIAMMFTSGVFFDVSERPEEIQAILRLNPFATILEGYRDVLLHGRTANLSALVYPAITSFSAFAAGIALLLRFDRYYPRALP